MRKFYTAILFFSCAACSFVKHNGSQFIVQQDKVDNFMAYNPTKNSLIKNLGYPSLELDSNVWLYYYYKTENFNFMPKKIREEVILLVYFDKNDGIVDHRYMKRTNFGSLEDMETRNIKNYDLKEN
ncbi:MAG: hypothetical protein LBB13_00615 [Rickettsiales bacterium]|jgi:outer membrane protein assembly factor BamE (lipoprotein component of BamABCDE complex)|nr:hypothetical protein [Rickettsiales bacterium]